MNPRLLRLVTTLLLCSVFVGRTLAQLPTTGTVTGRVYNPATQEYVRNAEVRLDGTPQIAVTESDGSFQFNHVTPGEAARPVADCGPGADRGMGA